MHTRVGLESLKRLIRTSEAIGKFFHENRVKAAHRALGWQLFFVEGGRIKNELIYEPLSRMEQKVVAHQCGLSPGKWLVLRILLEEAIENGLLERIHPKYSIISMGVVVQSIANSWVLGLAREYNKLTILLHYQQACLTN